MAKTYYAWTETETLTGTAWGNPTRVWPGLAQDARRKKVDTHHWGVQGEEFNDWFEHPDELAYEICSQYALHAWPDLKTATVMIHSVPMYHKYGCLWEVQGEEFDRWKCKVGLKWRRYMRRVDPWQIDLDLVRRWLARNLYPLHKHPCLLKYAVTGDKGDLTQYYRGLFDELDENSLSGSACAFFIEHSFEDFEAWLSSQETL